MSAIPSPQGLTCLLLPSGLGGKSVINQERGGGTVWHLGMQEVDSSCSVVAAGARHPSLRF